MVICRWSGLRVDQQSQVHPLFISYYVAFKSLDHFAHEQNNGIKFILLFFILSFTSWDTQTYYNDHSLIVHVMSCDTQIDCNDHSFIVLFIDCDTDID